jgi:CBS domain-containing protein
MTVTSVGAMTVSAFASDVVVRVAPDADLWEVCAALTAADIGAVAVGTPDKVTGVVSERDVVRALAARQDPSATTAKAVAHSSLVWCDAGSSVAEVAQEMMERYVRHVFVEDDGNVVGIVSARDLLGAYAASEYPDED